ncbi:hypothetical protein [Aquitalea magnusonii]|uniref:Uncharacterized protein n=1 Tax=Aquitalea magnusonii TaxID=332411 RepID=A0A318JJK1_9NEIS|nr:hypothetical protein [Aquitalea magnusonii]PXX49418.1 hypothetical protein DFR38_10458 [Aquitalea magnusonii]
MPLTESPRQATSAISKGQALPPATLSDNLRLQAKTLLGSLGRQARLELVSRGIHIPPAICLGSDQHGQVQLLSPHPQARQIRLWLRNSHYLRELFLELSSLFELLQACSTEQAFPASRRFCLGLTSAGPLAYFEEYPQPKAAHAG